MSRIPAKSSGRGSVRGGPQPGAKIDHWRSWVVRRTSRGSHLFPAVQQGPFGRGRLDPDRIRQWDSENRPSWVNIARPLAVTHEAVRREGGNLSREQFDAVGGGGSGEVPRKLMLNAYRIDQACIRTSRNRLHLVEVCLVADQRRRDLDDRVSAVVGAAVQSSVEQGLTGNPRSRRSESSASKVSLVVLSFTSSMP